jgi:hypothetical protein
LVVALSADVAGLRPSHACDSRHAIVGDRIGERRGLQTPGRSAWLHAVAYMVFCIAAADASAIGLGTPSLDSGLGEPLRLSLPVTLQPDEDVGCIQLRGKGDDLPAVLNMRSRVVRVGGQTRIEISSAQSVNEPAIGLVVSVGCTAPVAREFILFLDPPIAAPTPALGTPSTRSIVEPTVPRGLTQTPPRRPAAGARSAASGTGVPTSTPRPAARPKTQRPSRSRPPSTAAGAIALPRTTSPAVPATSGTAANGRDRLSVVPTEPPSTGGGSAASPGTGAAPAAATAGPATTGPAAASSTVVPGAVPPTSTVAPDADTLAREQALRQQQDMLQSQLKALSDQMAALRVQTTALAARNQALEESASTFSPLMIWLLIALAAVALLIAAWMSWRYMQLRRSLEGSPWWTGQTFQAPSTEGYVDDVDSPSDLAPLGGGTRMGARPLTKTDVRSGNAAPVPAVVASNVERSRPMGRSYPPAIETDFTVSDIEAAMATVRTVSGPRKPKPNLEDSDFAPLGGPTMPSPFTEPPAPGRRPGDYIVEEGAKFVDLDIPPMPTSPAGGKSARVAPQPDAEIEATEPLDFKLDLPGTFDPLSTDSHKRTEVERTDPRGVDFELPASTTALDFELPSATSIASLTTADDLHDEPRQGATALSDLFASDTGRLGPDTILDLDDRNGAPLSTTEVDRLTTTGILDDLDGSMPVTAQARMARFADLMNQVDEMAIADPLRAIAQLRQHVLRDENIPTLLWLRLFELYHAVGKKPVYEALGEHFTRRYHRPMVGWGQKLADRVPQTPLSAFKEIDREIEAAWGTEAGLARIRSLLCDRDQSDAVVFNAVLQRDLLDAAKIFLLDRDSSISSTNKT